MIRSDGYRMIGGLVQGARSYDPTSGQWLTPDPYAGDVRDLMSQKPFMWNGNNPVEWSDPSGYSTEEEEEEELVRPGLGYSTAEYNNVRAQVDRAYPGGESRSLRIAPEREGHMWDTREGHVPDTALNRAIIENTANNLKNYRGTDEQGNAWYTQTLKSGSQAWAEVRNGTITEAGINKTPLPFNEKSGLKQQPQPGNQPQRTQQTP